MAQRLKNLLSLPGNGPDLTPIRALSPNAQALATIDADVRSLFEPGSLLGREISVPQLVSQVVAGYGSLRASCHDLKHERLATEAKIQA
jgi:hypothetical protein